MSLVNAFDALT